MNDIVKGQIFGKVVAYSFSIEFQKRGLPHMHLLIILETTDKIVGDPAIINSIVQAEIPDPTVDGELHELIKTHMMHGPCGSAYPNSSCMKSIRGAVPKCQKRFPKDFCDETVFTRGTYPLYRRRNTGINIVKQHTELNNRWVVPYNRYLILKYQAHINVEICNSISCVKYLYKYFYKGHDRASLRIDNTDNVTSTDPTVQNVYNEIQQYIDARYIAAPEAAWRLFKKPMCDKSHTVYLLSVHLPDQQPVSFTEGHEAEAVERAGETTLTAWFKLNEQTPAARSIPYTDIPGKYVFKKNTKKWQARQRKSTTVIARMPLISPTQGEKFYLRLLLLHVIGATSFEFLRTVNGELMPTFKAAAIAKGLLETDDEWEKAMREAESFKMPSQLRMLFATILVYCNPQDPVGLWNMFSDAMSDCLRPEHLAKEIALKIIGRKLQALGKTLAQFGFDEPMIDQEYTENLEKIMTAEATMINQMNSEQSDVVTAVINAVESGIGECFFMKGPGGTGKTFVYNTIIQILTKRQVKVKVLASTGIAATLLKGGQTAHSAFKLLIPVTATTNSSMSRHSLEAQVYKEYKLIIWDEAPMQHRYVFEAVDRFLRDLMQNELPFGGKTVLLGGDFQQILPVIRGGTREACVDALITRSALWENFKVLSLTQNMRVAPEEHEFAAELLRVGTGTANVQHTNDMSLLGYRVCPPNVNFVQEVFGDFNSSIENLSSVAILCPHNEQSLLLNEEVLKILPGIATRYLSTDSLSENEEGNNTMIPTEFLHELTPNGMPPHILNIKVGAIIMLLRNINVSGGLCNGTRLQVMQMMPHVIVAKLLTGPCKGDQVFLPRLNLQPSDSDLTVKFTRRQFPVRLAFAMTINKAQGQTFSKIGLCLRASVFTHGQLYVALSRCRKKSEVCIRIPLDQKTTKNIVFPEVLL